MGDFLELGLALSSGADFEYVAPPPPDPFRFIWFGASITSGAIQEVGTAAYKASIDAAYPGHTTEVYDESVGGWTAADLHANIDAILATYTAAQNTYCIVEIGGNEVTANRPYATDTHLVQLAADIDYVLAAITAKGFIPVLSDLTFRDYFDLCFAKEQDGSRPYNVNIIRSRVAPAWKYASGKPFVQLYDITRNNYIPWFTAPENIHPNSVGNAGLRQHWMDTVCKKALTGADPVEIPATNAVTTKAWFVSDDQGATPTPSTWTRIVVANTANFSGRALLNGVASGVDTGWDLATTTPFIYGANTGSTTGSNSGIVPDTVLQNFCYGNSAAAGAGIIVLEFTGLDDTRLYSLGIGGSRATTGSRITKYTVNGDTAGAQSLETVNNTAAQAFFASIAPVAGKITVRIEFTNNQFAYCNWAVLTQLAN